jgi:CBS domain containing-hemolysin-like protein
MSDPHPSTAEAPKSRLGRLFQALRHRTARKPASDGTLRQTLEEAIEERGEAPTTDTNDLGDAERAMLRNLLDYGELKVYDVAVPRAHIVAFDIDDGFDALVKLFAEAAHSRLPVFRDTMDQIIGMVHVKDVMRHMASADAGPPRMDQLLRSVLYVPHSMKVLDLLARMRITRTHMAIVIDEYGGTDGLVTIEDLVEQIVGDIEDEHDDDPATMLREITPGLHEADARLALSELESVLGVDFLSDDDDEDTDTVGGLIFMMAGRVPAIGETLLHDETGFAFEIVDGDPRRVTKVRVQTPATPEGA